MPRIGKLLGRSGTVSPPEPQLAVVAIQGRSPAIAWLRTHDPTHFRLS